MTYLAITPSLRFLGDMQSPWSGGTPPSPANYGSSITVIHTWRVRKKTTKKNKNNRINTTKHPFGKEENGKWHKVVSGPRHFKWPTGKEEQGIPDLEVMWPGCSGQFSGRITFVLYLPQFLWAGRYGGGGGPSCRLPLFSSSLHVGKDMGGLGLP